MRLGAVTVFNVRKIGEAAEEEEPKKTPPHTARKRLMLKVIATNMSISPTRVSTNATVARVISTFQSQPLSQ